MNDMELTAQEELAAKAIGLEAMRYLKQTETIRKIARETEKHAIETLEEIRRVLNDDSVDDPECFQRIEAIICAMESGGLHINRHDF